MAAVVPELASCFRFRRFFFNPVHIFMQTIDKHAFLSRINIDFENKTSMLSIYLFNFNNLPILFIQKRTLGRKNVKNSYSSQYEKKN
jgi:hypothetical protein